MIAAKDLRELLIEVFPSFVNEWEDDEDGFTIHGVLLRFTDYFGKGKDQFSKKQILKLATIINDSVAIDDQLENAISTCFLEHLHQLNSVKLLKPHLSKLAKGKMHG